MSKLILNAGVPAYGGSCIGKWKEKVVFIKGALPGETIEAIINEEKKDYFTATVTDIKTPTPDRIKPECKYFGSCGGCQMQYASYAGQLKIKEAVLDDCLRRLAKIDISLIEPIYGNPWNYRHRGQFKISNGGIGFYREKSREVIDIDDCPLMTNEINSYLQKTRALLKESHELFHGISEIHISYGDCGVALIKMSSRDGRRGLNKLSSMFINAGFSGVVIESENKRISKYGGHFMTFALENLKYTISPMSFFQSHWELNQAVVKLIKDTLMPLKDKKILDLYSGAGNFSLPLAADAGEATGVEENPYTIEDGKRNLKINKIENYKFIQSSAEAASISGDIDILILDPPRLGLTNKVVERVLAAQLERIAYISCNPSTLSRDLKKLLVRYEIESVRMIDFFPQTYHVESLVFLRQR